MSEELKWDDIRAESAPHTPSSSSHTNSFVNNNSGFKTGSTISRSISHGILQQPEYGSISGSNQQSGSNELMGHDSSRQKSTHDTSPSGARYGHVPLSTQPMLDYSNPLQFLTPGFATGFYDNSIMRDGSPYYQPNIEPASTSQFNLRYQQQQDQLLNQQFQRTTVHQTGPIDPTFGNPGSFYQDGYLSALESAFRQAAPNPSLNPHFNPVLHQNINDILNNNQINYNNTTGAWLKFDEPNGLHRARRPRPPSNEVILTLPPSNSNNNPPNFLSPISHPPSSSSSSSNGSVGQPISGRSESTSNQENPDKHHDPRSRASSCSSAASSVDAEGVQHGFGEGNGNYNNNNNNQQHHQTLPNKSNPKSLNDSILRIQGRRVPTIELRLQGNIIKLAAQPAEHQVKDFNIIPMPVVVISPQFTTRTCDYIKALLICDDGMQLDDPIFLAAASARPNGATSPANEVSFVNLRVTKDMLKGRTKGYSFVISFTYGSDGVDLETIYTTPFWLYSNVNQEGFPKGERDSYLRPQWRDASSSFSNKKKR